jgi:hypothetical protein
MHFDVILLRTHKTLSLLFVYHWMNYIDYKTSYSVTPEQRKWL